MENYSNTVVEELNKNMTMVVLPVTIFIGVEAFVGTFGNILILLIYTKRYGRSNFRYFVLSMAVIDLTSCLTTLPGEIFSQMNWYTYKYDWICRVKSFINVQTAWGSASILLLLAFDRYRKICKPLAWQIQPSFALKLCICSLVLASMVAIPISILWGKQTYIYQHDGLNLTVSICEKSEKYADDIYPFVYITCVYILPVGLILFVVCSLNIITARKLFGKKRLSLSLPVKSTSALSSVYTSDTSLTTVATDTDIESFAMEPMTIKNHRENCIGINRNDLNNLDNNDSATDRTVDKNAAFAISENHRSESETNVSTRVSFIAKCEKHSSDPGKQCSPDHDIDFHFDIDISSQIVKNKGNNDRRNNDSCTPTCKVNDTSYKHVDHRCPKSSNHNASDFRRKQKTVIMLVLTVVFVITMLLYVILISFVAGTEGILKTLSNSQKVVFFFFWRLYFINTVINPILYGILDPRFRAGMRAIFKRKVHKKKNESKNCAKSSNKRKQPVFTLA